MKISMNGSDLKDYAKRVHNSSSLMRLAGNVHLRSRQVPPKQSGVSLLGREQLDADESADKLREYTEIRDQVFLADQSGVDLDRELGFSKLRLSGEEGTYRFSSTELQPGDPLRSYELQTADIDRYGDVARSVAMRSGPGGLEVVEVDGRIASEYLFVEGHETARKTDFMVSDHYQKETTGDKFRNWWNGLS